jgi:phosphoribosyl-ATP pyrophosphohydrolase
MERAAKKLGEEAVETVIAAVARATRAGLVSRKRPICFIIWLVVLAVAGIPLADVMAELERRTSVSPALPKRPRARTKE